MNLLNLISYIQKCFNHTCSYTKLRYELRLLIIFSKDILTPIERHMQFITPTLCRFSVEICVSFYQILFTIFPYKCIYVFRAYHRRIGAWVKKVLACNLSFVRKKKLKKIVRQYSHYIYSVNVYQTGSSYSVVHI